MLLYQLEYFWLQVIDYSQGESTSYIMKSLISQVARSSWKYKSRIGKLSNTPKSTRAQTSLIFLFLNVADPFMTELMVSTSPDIRFLQSQSKCKKSEICNHIFFYQGEKKKKNSYTISRRGFQLFCWPGC